jgi:hypothetical protein
MRRNEEGRGVGHSNISDMYLAHLTVLLHKLPLPTGELCDGARVWSTGIYAIDSVLRERNLPQNSLDVTNTDKCPSTRRGGGPRFRAAPEHFLEKCKKTNTLFAIQRANAKASRTNMIPRSTKIQPNGSTRTQACFFILI